MLNYVVKIEQENDAFLVSSRDIPELNSVGYSYEEALKEAVDGLETAFMLYMEQRRAIPSASEKQQDEAEVELPARVGLKVALYNEMLQQKVTKAELARRLSYNQKQIDRLWDLDHSTKLESLEQAFHALGRKLHISLA